MSRPYEPAEMSWSERRAADRRHFAALKDAATERIIEAYVNKVNTEQERVEARVAHTRFTCRDALQVYVAYERKANTKRELTPRDNDEVRAIVLAIWPAYAAARGIPETAISSTPAVTRDAQQQALS